MSSRPLARMFFRILLLPLDILGAVILAAAFLILYFVPFRPEKTRRLMSFVPGTSVEVARKKFGEKFRDMFFEDTAGGYFEEVTLFLYPLPAARRRHEWTSPATGERVVALERTPPFRVFYALGLVWMLCESIWIGKTRGISLVRGRDPYLYAAMAWWAAVMIRVPFVFSIHTDYDLLFSADPRHRPFLAGRWLGALARRILPRAALALPIRESMTEFLLRHGVNKDRIAVIPHGIDVSEFGRAPDRIREKLNLPANRRLVVSAGRVTVDNYFHHLPDIAERVRSRHLDVLFVAAGDGWDLERLRTETRNRGLESHLMWLGPIDRLDLLALWKEAAIGLVMKGGYSLIEACVAGCAVVSYNIEWHDELVEDRQTGRLVAPDSAEAAAAICDLLADEPNRRRMADAVCDRARSRHSLDTSIAARRAAYERAIFSNKKVY